MVLDVLDGETQFRADESSGEFRDQFFSRVSKARGLGVEITVEPCGVSGPVGAFVREGGVVERRGREGGARWHEDDVAHRVVARARATVFERCGNTGKTFCQCRLIFG